MDSRTSSRQMPLGSIRSCWQPILGRWRNGTPLVLSPDTDASSGGFDPERLNDFEYVNSDGSGDPRGVRCPIGAHIRRANPRGQPVAGQGKPGGSNNSHRLIRARHALRTGVRSQPSLRWHRARAAGVFREHVHREPVRVRAQPVVGVSAFVGKVRLSPKSKDPLIASNDPATSVFDIAQAVAPRCEPPGFPVS